MKTRPLSILLVEDVPADTELCVVALKQAGFSVQADLCSTAKDFERLIIATDYDIVLADYNLADWTGTEAIAIVHRLGKDTPVIVVTGHLGDEKAVDCIHQGASDYVLKDRLSRLPSAVRRAIDQNMLQRQTRLLAAAVSSVADGVLIAEAAANLMNARIVSVNDAFIHITGYTAEELIGKPLGFVQRNETGAESLADYEPKMPSLDLFMVETVEKRKSGALYYAEWQVSSIREGLDRISHYVVIHRDITDRKRTTAKLIHTNKELVRYSEELKKAKCHAETATRAKSDFLACVSHEIRTPLNAIIGMADVLSSTELSQEQSKYVEVFQRAGENLLSLINQLLDLSKIESGSFTLEQIDFDLNEVLTKVIALFEVPAHAKGLCLSFYVDKTPTNLIGDPQRLRQVLINLVGNAVKFTNTGSITIEVNLGDLLSATECSIQFTVADTGIGIPEDKLATIFEDFTQADSSITPRYGGTGLGLTISRAIVQKMKGNITVESVVGAGSTFRFAATFGLPSNSSEPQTKSAPWRVLLCEDSQDNALVVSSYLKGTNYAVEHAGDGQAGVDRFKSAAFDLVLMDLQMPVLDGKDATRQIRQWESDHRKKPTPILALTAHAQAEEVKRCEACGCTAFLSKPIRKATLLEALAKHIPQISLDYDQSEHASDAPELVPEYLTQKRGDLDKLRLAIEKADFAAISTLGHQLKGSGTSYGFEEFSQIGSAIERAAKTRDLEEARRQTEQLEGAVSEALSVSSKA